MRPMWIDEIERHVVLIVLNALNLPKDDRTSFVEAACIDLRVSGIEEATVQEIKRRATERLAEDDTGTGGSTDARI
jgi:hypothetical protein